MIHEEICTYEVCKLAKEKGFNEYVEAFYAEDCNTPHTQGPEKWNNYEGRYSAPTQNLLQRWLREEKFIDISIYPIFINGVRVYTAQMYAPNLNKPKKFNYFDTYELALEDALKYALENLV